MRLIWMHILLALLVLVVDGTKRSGSTLENNKENVNQEQPVANYTEDPKDLVEEEKEEEEDLPILPPIILLDFTNSSSDEKSKRTVNGNLGYGYDRNNLFSGKYNYYFPTGKTGTTVSIEESISPFLPKTIVESIKPVTEKPYGNQAENAYGGPSRFRTFPTTSTIQGQQQFGSNVRHSNVQQVFGQRTKLQKTTSTDFENYHSFSSTPRPTINAYSTPKSTVYPINSYTTARPIYEGYSTPGPNTYSNPIGTNSYVPGYNIEDYNSQRLVYEGSTPSPVGIGSGYSSGSTVLSSLGNFPRYTIENGVRYEHKIVWKYPDGKVSEVGPPPDTNSFARYNDLPAKVSPSSAGYQNLNSVSSFQNAQHPSYPTDVYSQNPVQFSKEQQIYPTQQTQFVSSASLPDQDYNSGPQVVPRQSYKLRYQPQFAVENGQDESLQNGVPSSSTFSRAKQTGSSLYEQRRPVSKYAVASSNPEYTDSTLTYPTNVSSGSSLFTDNGQLSPAILGKYTPQVQRYLKKVFAMSRHSGRQRYSSAKSHPSIQYSNLLSYNPSISQYIRNPASILNAQPTFVQVGNSLVPVIILRVDGVPPIQPNLTPNINLKALLQRYLTQYASSINNLAQNSNYEIGDEGSDKSQSSAGPHFDLTQLTQSLSQLSQNPSFAKNFAQSFARNVVQNSPSYDPYSYLMRSNYDGFKKVDGNKNDDSNNGKYAIRRPRPQKVKSVEIIEDPRFTSYKVKS